MVQNKPYVMFTFLPSGALSISGSLSASLTAAGTTTNPSMTLINQHYKKAVVTGTPAANYISFVLDPVTGRATAFQP
jgi:hypothetical protein